jgi:transposase
MTDPTDQVIGGVDTHGDFHVVAAIDGLGRLLDVESFATNRDGYRQAIRWLGSHGRLDRVGVEGTSSYGLGLCRHLHAAGIEVIEVTRPNRQVRRMKGKSDPTDALAAARAVLSGEADVPAKMHNGTIEAIRALRVPRRSAVTERTRVINQIHSLVHTAPDTLRAELDPLSNTELVERCSRLRPGPDPTDPLSATKTALRHLARRHQALEVELADIDRQLRTCVNHTAPPELLEMTGVGTEVASILLTAVGDNPHRLRSESSFAALCGVSPLDASSGRQRRHRLNRGGDRRANYALWRIALCRLRHDPDTRAYYQRRQHEGLTKREAIRCLKRHLARHVYRNLKPLVDAP